VYVYVCLYKHWICFAIVGKEVKSEQLRMKQLELEKVRLEESIMRMQTARASKDWGDDGYVICAICTAARVHDDHVLLQQRRKSM